MSKIQYKPMNHTHLAALLQREYTIDPYTYVVTNRRTRHVVQPEYGKQIHTPYGFITSTTFLYILIYGAHPKDDEFNSKERKREMRELMKKMQ